MFELLELSLADTQRFYEYKQNCSLELGFGLKGFDYGWLLASHEWKPADKILDVGGAYSELPVHIQQAFGCETWVVDDFGIAENDPFWTRNKSPQEYIAQRPQIKYVLERVGDPRNTSLPEGYFDIVYSVSVLEHVPAELTPAVWRHLGQLVKLGGELVHAIDIPFPSNGGLSKMLKATLFDTFLALVPANYRQTHFMATPKNYVNLVYHSLAMHGPVDHGLNVWRMSLDPEIMTEGFEYGYHRIMKDHIENYRHQRTGSLLIRLKKVV
jgi:Methyltransferase domain